MMHLPLNLIPEALKKAFATWALLWACVVPTQIAAQNSPYTFSTGKEISLLGAGAGLGVAGILKYNRVQPLTVSQIAALDPAGLPGFDRFATQNDSKTARTLSEATIGLAGLGTVALLIDKKVRNNFGQVFLLGTEGLLLTSGGSFAAKTFVQRTRPYAYNDDVSLSEKQRIDTRFSFFSQHTSTVSFLSFFSAKVFNDFHPDSKMRPWVFAGAGTLTAITGVLRVRGGKHFPTDVLTGAAFGALVGWGIPHLHKKSPKLDLTGYFSGNGYTCILTF